MEHLTSEQIESVKSWLADGLGVAEVQSKLEELFGLHMRYMDVRFLIDDIGAEIKENTPAPKPSPVAETEAMDKTRPQADDVAEFSANDGGVAEDALEDQQNEAPQGENSDACGKVVVSVSPIQRPGALAGGDVTFSDGVKAEWVVDQMGRLSLMSTPQGYTPPQADIPVFQRELQAQLSKIFG